MSDGVAAAARCAEQSEVLYKLLEQSLLIFDKIFFFFFFAIGLVKGEE